MPSCGLRHSRECWYPENCYGFLDDSEAWQYLQDRGFSEDRFLIKKPEEGHTVTEKEFAAICYLINEWGWGYEELVRPDQPQAPEQSKTVLFPKIAEEDNRIDVLDRKIRELEQRVAALEEEERAHG